MCKISLQCYLCVVLRTIERINLGKNIKYSEEWRAALKQDLQKQNLSLYHKLNSKIEDEEYRDKIGETRRKDYISHFLLRLAFCRTEELRRWFISQETDLFRFRYIEESKEIQANFLQENKMEYSPVSLWWFPFQNIRLD